MALPALQKAQEIYGFLPVEAQRIVAGELGKPLSEIYGIATFYSMFSLTPKGRNHISVCLGTACSSRSWASKAAAVPTMGGSAWTPAGAWAAAVWPR